MPKDTLLIATEAAQYLRVSPSTLSSWRINGKGPAWHRVGKRALYRETDLAAWLKGNKHAPSEAA